MESEPLYIIDTTLFVVTKRPKLPTPSRGPIQYDKLLAIALLPDPQLMVATEGVVSRFSDPGSCRLSTDRQCSIDARTPLLEPLLTPDEIAQTVQGYSFNYILCCAATTKKMAFSSLIGNNLHYLVEKDSQMGVYARWDAKHRVDDDEWLILSSSCGPQGEVEGLVEENPGERPPGEDLLLPFEINFRPGLIGHEFATMYWIPVEHGSAFAELPRFQRFTGRNMRLGRTEFNFCDLGVSACLISGTLATYFSARRVLDYIVFD